jgi:hypothetical protein
MCRCSEVVEACFFAGDEFIAADMDFWNPVTRFTCEEEQVAAAGWVALTAHEVQRAQSWAARKAFRCREVQHRVYVFFDEFQEPEDDNNNNSNNSNNNNYSDNVFEDYIDALLLQQNSSDAFVIDMPPEYELQDSQDSQEPPYPAPAFL